MSPIANRRVVLFSLILLPAQLNHFSLTLCVYSSRTVYIAMLIPIALPLIFFSRLVQAESSWAFMPVVKAHTRPSACPSNIMGTIYSPDPQDYVCCPTVTSPKSFIGATPTSAEDGYGCCPSGYTCTGVMPAMQDWVEDANSESQAPSP